MKTSKALAMFMGGTTLAAAGSAQAGFIILSEDWQSPILPDATTQVDNTNTFLGWDFPSARNNIFKVRHQLNDGHPQAGLTPNQALQFEWADAYASYDTTWNWTNFDAYEVSFNATEQSWNNANDRYVGIRIRETVSGNLLWQGHSQLTEYDGAHAGAGDDWSPDQFYTLNFSASDFGTVFGTTTGTEGSLLTFEIGSVTRDLVDGSSYPNVNRGLYVDNITFSVDAIPEPGSMALLAVGGLLMARRRRSA